MKTISILSSGYSMNKAMWALLQVENINSKTYVDNGFDVIEVAEKDLDKTLLLIEKTYKEDKIVSIQNTYSEGVEYRANYWVNSAKEN